MGEIAFVLAALDREVRGQLQHREAGSETVVVVARGHFSRERLSAWWGFNLRPPAEERYSSSTQCWRTVRARTTKWKHFAGVDPRRPEHNKRWGYTLSTISFSWEDSAVCVVVESLCDKLNVCSVSMNCISKSKVWIACVDEEKAAGGSGRWCQNSFKKLAPDFENSPENNLKTTWPSMTVYS